MPKVRLALAGLLLAASPVAFAQQTAGPVARPPQAPLQIPSPHYISIPMEIDVKAPADKVWARVGKFCDIGEWNNAPTCKITSGQDGEFGAMRTVGTEILAGKTRYSYTYAQAPREGTPFNLYHGTLDAEPLTATTTRLRYTVFFDNSMLADDAAREADIKARRIRFTTALQNMKILAEGGTMPAPVAPPTPTTPRPPAATPAPFLSLNQHYVSIPMETQVNAPVDKVWARIGKFCDIGEWGFPGCTLISGTDGEFGAVRTTGNEVLVGKTKYSYIYTQPLRTSGAYIMYHGTLEARALTPTTTLLLYTLLYDNSNLADDTARDADIARRRTQFTGLLQNMKILSEGGTLPPGAIRAPGRPTPPPPAK